MPTNAFLQGAVDQARTDAELANQSELRRRDMLAQGIWNTINSAEDLSEQDIAGLLDELNKIYGSKASKNVLDIAKEGLSRLFGMSKPPPSVREGVQGDITGMLEGRTPEFGGGVAGATAPSSSGVKPTGMTQQVTAGDTPPPSMRQGGATPAPVPPPSMQQAQPAPRPTSEPRSLAGILAAQPGPLARRRQEAEIDRDVEIDTLEQELEIRGDAELERLSRDLAIREPFVLREIQARAEAAKPDPTDTLQTVVKGADDYYAVIMPADGGPPKSVALGMEIEAEPASAAQTIQIGNRIKQWNPETSQYDIDVGEAPAGGTGAGGTIFERLYGDAANPQTYQEFLRLSGVSRSGGEEVIDSFVNGMADGSVPNISSIPSALRGEVLRRADEQGITTINQTDRDAIRKLDMATALTEQLEEFSQRLSENPTDIEAAFVLNGLRQAATGLFSKGVFAEVGVLTDQDIARVQALIPGVIRSAFAPGISEAQFNELRRIIDSAKAGFGQQGGGGADPLGIRQ